MNYVTITPAYGRDYKSQKEVLAAWNENRDFIIEDFMHPDCGRYVNKEEAKSSPGTTWNIRYSKNSKVLPVKL